MSSINDLSKLLAEAVAAAEARFNRDAETINDLLKTIRQLQRVLANVPDSIRQKAEGLAQIDTIYERKAIPSRDFDWTAVTDNYDGAEDAARSPTGHGTTETEAVADLESQLQDHES